MQFNSEIDAEECRNAMQAYYRDVVLVPRPARVQASASGRATNLLSSLD
jgi:hypothetical protein